ncbi:MAG: TetR/AcrR family transcriptional regulator [Streptosporangiaceae bacterium]|nr:TetR/AcrR family transcriptional regulator [Streptosporangiaceae bacterium]MBV9856767.1 TetR/AcrR family transcriptional regulator [Streptosporangiaceae bacterium]
MADEGRHGGPAAPNPGRRERKKAEVRQRISDAATALFLRHGFDQVSVSEIAEAADVARPTVFAHFPRKEDLFFDRYPQVAGQLTQAIRQRPAGTSAVSALRDTLVAAAQAGQAPYGMQADMIPWWRTVAASRALQARARELADQLSAELAAAMAATGTAEPELAAALAVAAYRTVHLQAIRCILAGEDATTVAARHPDRIRSALSAVGQMTA